MIKMRFFIIHGAYGNPDGNWFPWLKKELELLGHEVIIPQFPTPENQTLDNWIKVFREYFPKINSDTIFIGHSLAPAFILSVLERIDIKIKACFFVAGFVGLIGKEEFDIINNTFITKKFNWSKIKENCGRFYIYNSDNDPYVPLSKGEELANRLDSKLIIVDNAGHFNEDSGYKEFPKILEDIKTQE